MPSAAEAASARSGCSADTPHERWLLNVSDAATGSKVTAVSGVPGDTPHERWLLNVSDAATGSKVTADRRSGDVSNVGRTMEDETRLGQANPHSIGH